MDKKTQNLIQEIEAIQKAEQLLDQKVAKNLPYEAGKIAAEIKTFLPIDEAT